MKKRIAGLIFCALCLSSLSQDISFFNRGFLRQGNAQLDRAYLGILDNPINTNTPAGMTNVILAIGGGGGGGSGNTIFTNDLGVIHPIGTNQLSNFGVGTDWQLEPGYMFTVGHITTLSGIFQSSWLFEQGSDPNFTNDAFTSISGVASTNSSVASLNQTWYVQTVSTNFTFTLSLDAGTPANSFIDFTGGGSSLVHIDSAGVVTANGYTVPNLFKSPTNSPAIGQILQSTSTAGDSKWGYDSALSNSINAAFIRNLNGQGTNTTFSGTFNVGSVGLDVSGTYPWSFGDTASRSGVSINFVDIENRSDPTGTNDAYFLFNPLTTSGANPARAHYQMGAYLNGDPTQGELFDLFDMAKAGGQGYTWWSSNGVRVVGFWHSNNVFNANGFASFNANLGAPVTITVGASPFSWTNNTGANVQVFLDASGATTAVAINGTTVFTSLVGGDHTLGLQNKEYFTCTYSISTPVIKYHPF